MTILSASANVTPPTVHLNGSGRENLMRDYENALHALTAAQDALGQTAPHPRDFYIHEDGDLRFRVAQRQHFARMEALRNIHEEIEALGVAVIDQ